MSYRTPRTSTRTRRPRRPASGSSVQGTAWSPPSTHLPDVGANALALTLPKAGAIAPAVCRSLTPLPVSGATEQATSRQRDYSA